MESVNDKNLRLSNDKWTTKSSFIEHDGIKAFTIISSSSAGAISRGYVSIPVNHPYHGLCAPVLSLMAIHVPGGLKYTENASKLPRLVVRKYELKGNEWVLGFDAVNSDDIVNDVKGLLSQLHDAVANPQWGAINEGRIHYYGI